MLAICLRGHLTGCINRGGLLYVLTNIIFSKETKDSQGSDHAIEIAFYCTLGECPEQKAPTGTQTSDLVKFQYLLYINIIKKNGSYLRPLSRGK